MAKQEARTLGAPHVASAFGSGTYARAPIKRVFQTPHPVLAHAAVLVDPCDEKIVLLADALVATMRASPACVGLAATQIGESAHLFCMDVSGHKKTKSCAGLVVLANARIVVSSGEIVMREGCMSVPHLTGNVARASEVVVEGREPGTARIVRIHADAMEARCLQHEIDHLEGLVFVDRVRDRDADLFARKAYA
jgi:peptide deformylase